MNLALPLARYRLEFAVETPLHLPVYAGSTLRGAFGGALRAASCMTKQKTCDGCPLLQTCPYAVVFETRPPEEYALKKFTEIPHPYVIEPPPWGERNYAPGEVLVFHLVLTGRALDQLALILWAFGCAFKRGVGRGDGAARLLRVFHVGATETVVLDGPEGTIVEHDTTVPPPPQFSAGHITLHLDSPLRLARNGNPIHKDALTANDLIMGLVRRIASIHKFHGNGPLALDFSGLAAKAEDIASEKSLEWRDWKRYSSRQGKKMALGGVVGTWTFKGDLAPFFPFLYLGQWLHVGKAATFGLGGYRMEMA